VKNSITQWIGPKLKKSWQMGPPRQHDADSGLCVDGMIAGSSLKGR
jgi:hypothetical protein